VEEGSVVFDSSIEGSDTVPLAVHDRLLSCARDWLQGAVLVIDGDSYVHIGLAGRVKNTVPLAIEAHR
jgi:hypothetical protein